MGLKLKDRLGTEVDYGAVTQIVAPFDNNAGYANYVRLASLKVYIIEGVGSIGGVSAYKILEKLSVFGTDSLIMFSVSSGNIDDTFYFVTTKNLTVGNTYPVDEMYDTY